MTPTEKALWLFSAVQASAVIFLLFERVSHLRMIGNISRWMEFQKKINDLVDNDINRINKHIFK